MYVCVCVCVTWLCLRGCAGAPWLQRYAGATLHCRAQVFHGGGFSCCRARALVGVVHEFNCSAFGIFPDQGLNPCPLYWQADS